MSEPDAVASERTALSETAAVERRGESLSGADIPSPAPQQDVGPHQPVTPSLRSSLEAVLMVVDEPVSSARLASALEVSHAAVEAALTELAREYRDQGRGFDLRQVAGGWRFYSHPDHAELIGQFVLDGQSARLTQAALETLAVIAYSQPVTRGRISAIRGVNVDSVVRTLIARGLIEEAGQDADGGAYLYRTTRHFDERMGIDSIADLPSLAPYFPDLSTVDFEGVDS